MARIEWVDQRLRLWAEWCTVGDGAGYSAMSTLHPEWSPPTPGRTPNMKVAPPHSGRETDRAVKMLSDRLQLALWLRYCCNISVEDQGRRLAEKEGRARPLVPGAVDARIWRAHGLLAGQLTPPRGV